MTISTFDYQLPDLTHNLYDVTFFSDEIHTLVTHTPALVTSWLHPIEQQNRHLIVGLDVEWRPSFNPRVEHPVATLQLCVGRQCLIFQLIHAPNIPQSLINFLGNENHTFVGVGIGSDVEKLVEDYGLAVANVVDLRSLAAEELGRRELKSAGLKSLAKEVLGKEIEKPRRVTMSRWDNEWLTCAQVQYACVDAFLSSEIGTSLMVGASL